MGMKGLGFLKESLEVSTTVPLPLRLICTVIHSLTLNRLHFHLGHRDRLGLHASEVASGTFVGSLPSVAGLAVAEVDHSLNTSE